MKKNLLNIFFLLIISFFVFMPMLSFAQAGLVPCGTDSYPKGHKDASGNLDEYQIINPCGYNEIFDLISNVTNFLIFVIALPVAAIMFTYAGFLFAFSGMQPEARSKAKKIFGNVVFGFILAIAAWLIVHTILSALGFDGSWIGL